MPLLTFNEYGIYCEHAGVYIDPLKPVKKALITHAHSDHSRVGMGFYVTHNDSIPVMRHRLGQEIKVRGLDYGASFMVNGVKFSFHPAGHIPGSAQIRVEFKGEVWVVSGDYKLEADGLSQTFEPVPCHHFVTESTFGLPIYNWVDQVDIFAQVNKWWEKNKEEDKVSVIAAYALGKAQRVLRGLNVEQGKVFTHGAVENTNAILREQGILLPKTQQVSPSHTKKDFKGSIVICPPSALNTPWMRKLGTSSTAFCSGWMALRGARRRRAADRGFVLSDHADWAGLIKAVESTGAENVYTAHGYKHALARYLSEEKKLNAVSVDQLFTRSGEE